jgi:hypothetical protein
MAGVSEVGNNIFTDALEGKNNFSCDTPERAIIWLPVGGSYASTKEKGSLSGVSEPRSESTSTV